MARESGTSLSSPGSTPMANDDRTRAMAEFKRAITWVVIAGVLMVVGAITYLALTGDLRTHMVVATIIGAFLSVLLGGGLMAASFFSDKSGHDQSINDATSKRDDEG